MPKPTQERKSGTKFVARVMVITMIVVVVLMLSGVFDLAARPYQ